MAMSPDKNQKINPPVFHNVVLGCVKPVHKNIFFVVTCELIVGLPLWIRIFKNCR